MFLARHTFLGPCNAKRDGPSARQHIRTSAAPPRVDRFFEKKCRGRSRAVTGPIKDLAALAESQVSSSVGTAHSCRRHIGRSTLATQDDSEKQRTFCTFHDDTRNILSSVGCIASTAV